MINTFTPTYYKLKQYNKNIIISSDSKTQMSSLFIRLNNKLLIVDNLKCNAKYHYYFTILDNKLMAQINYL